LLNSAEEENSQKNELNDSVAKDISPDTRFNRDLMFTEARFHQLMTINLNELLSLFRWENKVEGFVSAMLIPSELMI
jgi:hypothetical protein